MSPDQTVETACRTLARDHYENFPVASLLLPRRLRRAVSVIYAFARTADDFADEGNIPPVQRLALIQNYRTQLDALRAEAQPQDRLFTALAEVVREHNLSLAPFYDLLSAFQQDVTKMQYADSAEVLDYCSRSANPIGHILLQLYRADSPDNRALSDCICTALQLINFLQDIKTDYAHGRIYIPFDAMQRFGVSVQNIAARHTDGCWRAMIAAEIRHARTLLRRGAPLAKTLGGRVGVELRFVLAGGFCVLTKLDRQNRKGLVGGARLGPLDWLRILPLAASVV